MTTLRRVTHFVGSDGTTTWTIPTIGLEYKASQQYDAPAEPLLVQDYEYDFFGSYPGIKKPGTEVVRFKLINDTVVNLDTAFDTLVATLYRGGMGKLWSLGADGTYRWCKARVQERPSYSLAVRQDQFTYVTVVFRRNSDWFAENAVSGSVTLSASPTTFTITNTGNARIKPGPAGLQFTLRVSSNPGFVNPRIENLTLVQQIDTTRDSASTGDRLLYDCGGSVPGGRVMYSTDSGANYADDYSLVTLPDDQGVLMELEPGDNSMKYTDGGTPHAVLDYVFYPAWH